MIENQSKKILIVEDEQNLGSTLQEYLIGKSHDVIWHSHCEQAWNEFQNTNFDIVLMDIGLPDGSGLDLAKKMRHENKNFILLFLSALNDPDTKLEGLEIGAEDYLTKPFSLKELNIRLQKSFKYKDESNALDECYQHGPLKIWFSRFQVASGNGEIINLGQKECAILKLLYTNENQVFNRDQIIDHVWGEDKYPSHRTVDNYIVKLRKWCETDNDEHLQIISIRAVGYKLTIKKD